MHIRYKRHSGFSLLELMAVVLIAMILTIVAVNSYSAMKQRRSLRSAAESVRDVFTNARSLAVSRNAWHRVVFQIHDATTTETKVGYWIDEIDPGTSTDPHPATLDDHVRALVVPWQDLTQPVELASISIKGTNWIVTSTTTPVTAVNPYFVIRFMPNGNADAANVQLREPSKVQPGGEIYSDVRLYPATAKANVVAAKP